MVLNLSGDKDIDIKDSKGSMIARTSFKEPITDVLWSGDQTSVLISTCDTTEKKNNNRIYRYQWTSNKQELAIDNALSFWNTDTAIGKYVICGQKSKMLTSEMVSQTAVRDPASIIFLDANNLKFIFATGQNCGTYTLSPDMNNVAYIELAKDEYGDYFRHDLKVADIKTGKMMNPAFGRRSLKYIWAGNKAIVYVEPDKYDLLCIRLFDMNSGKTETFIPSMSVPAIKLVAYEEQTGILYYKILDTYSSSMDDPVCWAVSLGRKPVSSEQNSFPKPKSEAVRKLVMPGMPTALPTLKGAAK